MISDDSKLNEVFQAYRAACPEVEPSPNFMPNLWQRIENRHSFGFVFQNMARTTMAACAALCLLLLVLNFASPFEERMAQAPNYTDVLAAEHTAETTYFTEGLRSAPASSNEEGPAAPNR
jgi:hypothetical protein